MEDSLTTNPSPTGDKPGKTGGDVNTKYVTEGKSVDGKDIVSTDVNSTLTVRSPLRPSRTVPAVPESYGDDNDASFETKQVRLNTSDLATTTAKTFIEKESSNAAEEKVSILQRQNRTLLKQIVAMKQANAYSGTNSVTFGNTSNRLTNTDMATTLSRNSSGDASSAGEGEAMKPLEFMKNQLALCELKLRRAHKNYHELSKRTRQLETENIRAEKNMLELSHRFKLCQDQLQAKEKSQLKLETAHQNACKEIAKLKDSKENEIKNRIKELQDTNEALVKHAKMCEERVIRSEKLALKYQQQFETSQAQGVKWKKDRQDIGNYALTLEKALKRAHNDIESFKRTRTTNVQHGMQPIGDNSMNTAKVPLQASVGVVHKHAVKHDYNDGTVNSQPSTPKATFITNSEKNTPTHTPSPPPSPPTPDDNSKLYRAPPPSAPVTQEFFS